MIGLKEFHPVELLARKIGHARVGLVFARIGPGLKQGNGQIGQNARVDPLHQLPRFRIMPALEPVDRHGQPRECIFRRDFQCHFGKARGLRHIAVGNIKHIGAFKNFRVRWADLQGAAELARGGDRVPVVLRLLRGEIGAIVARPTNAV